MRNRRSAPSAPSPNQIARLTQGRSPSAGRRAPTVAHRGFVPQRQGPGRVSE
jgi:hypothetical protein